jgi:hypothetical protein
MKAWEIQDDHWDGDYTIVFHNDGIKAKRIGSERLKLNPNYTSCIRRPGFDIYSKTGFVPPKLLIEQKMWLFKCSHCGANIAITISDLSEIVYDKDKVFCNQLCYDAHNKESL